MISMLIFLFVQIFAVIFEEAAEILESHVLACLTPYTEHVIMIGDHKQLKPFTSNYRHSRTWQLNISLFERLFVNNLKGYTLNVQYRMRPCIADLIHPTFYTELNNDDTVNSYPKVRNMHKDLYFYTHNEIEYYSEVCVAIHNIMFIVPSSLLLQIDIIIVIMGFIYFQDECSIFNQYEVEKILELAKFLIEKASYKANDIVVLSPYAKQVERLKSKVRLILIHQIEIKYIITLVLQAHTCFGSIKLNISTVDSFQGLEANIVLLSLVRSNIKGNIGFLKEKNRICVALSRAKHGLYIIGNLPLLAKCSETWRSIEQKLKSQEAIGNTFPIMNEEKQ